MKPIITIFEEIHASGIEYLSEFADLRLACGVDRMHCLKLASESDAIVVKSVVKFDKELLEYSPRLRVIGRAGTGVDNINVLEAKKIKVILFLMEVNMMSHLNNYYLK